MTRRENIKVLKKICKEDQSHAVLARIELGGPYLKTKYGSKYTVKVRVVFRPWFEKHPHLGYSSAYEFECRTLSGARRCVEELAKAMPTDCKIETNGV